MFSVQTNKRIVFGAAVLVAGLLWSDFSSLAQSAQTYKARLSVVPVANARGRAEIDQSADVFATANVTGTLVGTKLTVAGTFDNFKHPASIAQIRSGPAMGVRGPVLFDLTVTKATKGTISGAVDLTAAQVDLLKNNRLYVQIHNQNTPEGALWGWFMK
ncbi:MAG TPA: CHRD domain-containing protein [Terriglobia bacterium]|nr:CHRD domain-containing protein [Terriglobia bacterium]